MEEAKGISLPPSPPLSPCNLFLFSQLKEKSEKAHVAMAKKKEAFKQGKTLGISGREMFLFNPELVAGDEEDAEEGSVLYLQKETGEGEEEGGEVAIDLTNFAMTTKISTDTVKSEGEVSPEAGMQCDL